MLKYTKQGCRFQDLKKSKMADDRHLDGYHFKN